ncbi:hypothetical protein PG994_008502 [Apiospora phragmitis]|uniref:Ankyrin repeat protein n=1 Tax=Apiospora phragmitis TaxID=2905665 RepID=A0ABR1UJL8_9PEZI
MLEILLDYADRSRMNELGVDGFALIHLPSHLESLWMLELLIQHGADPNLRVHNGRRDPALVHVLKSKHFDYASALLGHGADPYMANIKGLDAVLTACRMGATQFLEDIYCAKEIEGKINWRRTCTFVWRENRYSDVNGLHLAASNGKVAVLEFYTNHDLLESLESRSGNGFRPLHYAAMGGYEEVVKFLCLNGCDINAKGEDGSTALHLAAKFGHYEVVKRLKHSGCKWSLDAAGWSTLFYAHQSNEERLIEYLTTDNYNAIVDTKRGNMAFGIASTLRAKAAAKAFEDAIDKDDIALCYKLNSSGCDLDGFLLSCGGCSPLIKAIHNRRLRITE